MRQCSHDGCQLIIYEKKIGRDNDFWNLFMSAAIFTPGAMEQGFWFVEQTGVDISGSIAVAKNPILLKELERQTI